MYFVWFYLLYMITVERKTEEGGGEGIVVIRRSEKDRTKKKIETRKAGKQSVKRKEK